MALGFTDKICVCFGTRPELIKLAPIISEIKALEFRHEDERGHELALLLVHTGQHYDTSMSDSFIQDLKIPEPNYNLEVKSLPQAHQVALIMGRFEQVLVQERPDIVIVLGDTNSALGCALAAVKNGINVAHVEAGCRSFDMKQQEEVNRVLIDHIARLNFAATQNCANNLHNEGLVYNYIITGHPIVDLLHQVKDKIVCPSDLPTKGYALLTLHRLENISNKERLRDIVRALRDLHIFIVWPMHPHTKKQIKRYELGRWFDYNCTRVIEPVPYLQSLGLIKHARFVLTDSGGVQQEAALLGTPCITLRDRTEWPETLDACINTLAGSGQEAIKFAVQYIEQYKSSQRFSSDMFGRLGASKRIVDAIMSLLRPRDSVLQSTDIGQQAPA